MKAIAIIITLFFLICKVDAQHTVVSATKMNVLYWDLQNPIEVSVSNLPCSGLNLTASNGEITKADSCSYSILPDKPGNSFVNVYNSDNELLRSIEFRVKQLPEPKVYFFHGLDENNRPFGQMGLSADLENFDIDISYKIISYSASWISGSDTLAKVKCSGYRITDDVKQYFSKMENGDRIVFDNITAIFPRGNERVLERYIYRFKE